MTFKDRILHIVSRIPRGTTLSYKEVASLAGNPRASRAAARILASNTDPTIPCHRVIKSDGSLGGYNGINGDSKKALLEKEGAI